MSRSLKFIAILLLFLAASAALATAQKAKRSSSSSVPSQNDTKSGGPFLLNATDGPWLYFPIIHQHGAGRCYGYLQVSDTQVRYRVVTGDKKHEFEYPKEQVAARRNRNFLAMDLPRGHYDIIPTNQHMLDSRNPFATGLNARDPDPILFAIENFRTALLPFSSMITMNNPLQAQQPATPPPQPKQPDTQPVKPADDLNPDPTVTPRT